MIKKFKIIVLAITTTSLCFTWGCSGKPSIKENKSTSSYEESSKTNDKKDVELKLWSWFSLGNQLKKFESENKGIKIKEELFSFDKCKEEYTKALFSGEGPDIFVFDSSFFGQYTTNNTLLDLLQEPFSAGKYQKDFIGWDSGLSLDKKQLLSLTISTSPYITMYRADIMKENGFPSEPNEFGKFIEKPENIMKLAKKLFETKKYILQYPTDLADITEATLGFFDDNLNYICTGDLFEKSLDIGIEVKRNGMMSNVNFWGEDGKKAILENKIVMVPAPSYGMTTLKRDAPEQKGKWRVTKAPLGSVAWASDSRMAINSQSSFKLQAWKFMEYITTQKDNNGSDYTIVSGYIPSHKDKRNMDQKDEYFGGQNIYPMLEDLSEKMVQHKLTPLDSKALEIYRNDVWSAVQGKLSSSDVAAKMKQEIEIATNEQKRDLLMK
ncbi:MAG TPA: ABC transporter substrate-binding protein [Clostridia bacterium]